MLARGNSFSLPCAQGSVLQLWQSANTLLSVGGEPIGPTRSMRSLKVNIMNRHHVSTYLCPRGLRLAQERRADVGVVERQLDQRCSVVAVVLARDGDAAV